MASTEEPGTGEPGDAWKMPLGEAMTTQRALRRLRVDPVDDDLVLELLRLAVRAPSAENHQNWDFVVVRDPAVKHQLARLNRQAWSVAKRIARRRIRNDWRMEGVIDAIQWQADHFEETPVVIVACTRGGRLSRLVGVGAASHYGSIFPAVQNLLLAARAAGLGANLTTMPLWSTTLARRTLGLPSDVTPCAVIPLGWPRGRYGPTTRRPVEEVVHLDRYGDRAFLPHHHHHH